LIAGVLTLATVALAQAPPAWQEPLDQHRWAEAETLLKRVLAEGETAPALSGLALVYRATGRIQEADPILERLIQLDESAANVEELARIKAGLGNLDRAEELYRRALMLRGDIDPAESIAVHQRLSQVLVAEKKLTDAEREAAVAVSLRMRVAGQKNGDLADDYAVLARIYEAEKNLQSATRIWQTVAEIQADAFGYDSIRLADTLDSLALCQYQLESVDEAVSSLRRALAIREINLGPSSAEVAHTADRLGIVLFNTKHYADAEPFYRRALDIFMMLEPGDPILARSYDNLAVTEAMLEKYDEAESLYRESLKLRDGEDAIGLYNLAVLVARRKPTEAEPLYARALAVLDAPGNTNAELLKKVLTEYASLLRDLKRPAEALKLEVRLNAGKPSPQPKAPPVPAKQ